MDLSLLGLLSGVLVIVLLALTITVVRADERIVVFRRGRTGRWLIKGSAAPGRWQIVFLVPIVDRPVRVRGDLLDAWDEVGLALPEGWSVARPAEDRSRGVWVVRAEGPERQPSGPQQVDAEGQTQAIALRELVRRVRGPSAHPGARSGGGTAGRSGRARRRAWRSRPPE